MMLTLALHVKKCRRYATVRYWNTQLTCTQIHEAVPDGIEMLNYNFKKPYFEPPEDFSVFNSRLAPTYH